MLEQHTIGTLDAFDVIGLHVQPTVGQGLGAGRHVERAHLVGAGGETGVGPQRSTFLRVTPRVQVQVVRHSVRGVDHAVQSDDLRESGVGTVDRGPGHLGQGAHWTTDAIGGHERIVGIVRIGQRARQGAIDQIVTLCAGGDGRGEDEHLDARSGLTRCQRHVHLVATGHEGLGAHHGAHRAGLAVERHDRGVDSGSVGGQLLPSGFLRGLLGDGVEGGVDAQTPTEELVVTLLIGVAEQVALVQQIGLHLFAEMRPDDPLPGDLLNDLRQLPAPLASRDVAWIVRADETELDLLGHHRVHEALVDERVECLTESTPALLRMTNGVVRGRRLDQTGQERPLDQCERADALAEVHLGCRLDAVGVVAEEDGVQVALEDLVLRAHFLQS